jgi:hypothetical protein
VTTLHSSPRFGFGMVAWLLIGISDVACHRDQQAGSLGMQSAEPPGSNARVNSTSPAGSARPEFEAPRRTAKGRVVAIGDLHGDLGAARRALRLAKVVDESDRWIGGDCAVVQTGDLLDRGDEERPLLEWFERLSTIAHQGGGALYRLNGNHEVMNVSGDMRYVTAKGFLAFAEYAQHPLPVGLQEVPEAQRGRMMAFLPGGPWALRLAQYSVVLIVNDSVFSHGGLLPKHVDYGLDRINNEISSWMRGTGRLSPLVVSDDAPFWSRAYGESVSDADCKMLEGLLARLSVKRLVVGHTPQKDGISFACDRRVVRIDVGLSHYYGNNPPSVLEINGDQVTVLTEKPPTGTVSAPRSTKRAEAHP